MKYRILGKTQLKVSVIGLGTWQLGGEWGKQFAQPEVDAMFARAAELGINLVDTAECYGDHLGEQLIGAAIRSRRDRWIIATKFGHRYLTPFQRGQSFDPASVQRQLEGSLRALGVEAIDIYQFHSGTNQQFDTPGLWEMLNEQVRRGRIRHLGVSVSGNGNLYQTEGADRVKAGMVQVIYNRLDRKSEAELFAATQHLNLGVLARVPLASGFLTGKYTPQSQFPPDDVRGMADANRESQLRKIAEAQEVKQTEVPPGVSMAQWALAWCLQHEAVAGVIPGCKNVEQVELNAAAGDLAMVKEDHPLAAT